MIAETEITPLNDIKTRHTVTGRAHAVVRGNQPRITIAEGNSAFADVQIKASDYKEGGSTLPDDLKKGELVSVEDAFFQINYKGAFVLKVDPFARVLRLQEGDDEISLHTPRARWNVAGTVVYRTEKRGRSARGDWCRQGLMIMDETGSLKVEGWQADWDHSTKCSLLVTVLSLPTLVLMVGLLLNEEKCIVHHGCTSCTTNHLMRPL